MRLFTAIDLPEAVRDSLAMMCCGLPGARWVIPEQLHLTLRFIGDVDHSMLPDIVDVLEGVSCAPFSVTLQGTGFFPPRKKPQIVWAGVEKNDGLLVLRNNIEAGLVSVGLTPEKRKFFPHITLARLQRTPSSWVGRYLEDHGLFFCPPFQVNSFQLYSSVLNPKGARHYSEQEFIFTGRE